MFNDVRHRRVARDKQRAICISRSRSMTDDGFADLPGRGKCLRGLRNYNRFVLPLLPVIEAKFGNIEE
jgi:hypothetical protein